MKDICQNFLPYSPWDNIATSRLPGIQPLENSKMLFIKDEAFNAQMSYRDYLIKEKRSEVFYLNNKSLSAAQELLEFILNIVVSGFLIINSISSPEIVIPEYLL